VLVVMNRRQPMMNSIAFEWIGASEMKVNPDIIYAEIDKRAQQSSTFIPSMM
jgi:hypothetical protein